MSTLKPATVAGFLALLFIMIFCPDSEACWRSRHHRHCRSRCYAECGPEFCGQSFYGVSPYMAKSCPAGYTWANCINGVWTSVSFTQPGYCINTQTLLGKPCYQIQRPYYAEDRGLRFRMVCEGGVFRVARPLECPDGYFPWSFRGEPCCK